MPLVFEYHSEVVRKHPGIVGGIVLGTGLVNGATPPDLLEVFRTEQTQVMRRCDGLSWGDIEALAAWRSAFRRFGVEPTRYRSAAEALLRRLVKTGSLPSINKLVDIGNLISIRYALPIAVIDRRRVHGTIEVRFADGGERFTNLGGEDGDPIVPGEVIFTDAAAAVIARRWCWRQSAESAAVFDTTEILVTIESQHAGGAQDVTQAVTDLIELLGRHAGGSYNYAVLNAERRSFTV